MKGVHSLLTISLGYLLIALSCRPLERILRSDSIVVGVSLATLSTVGGHFVGWRLLGSEPLRVFFSSLSSILAWRFATLDIDISKPTRFSWEKWFLLAAGVGLYFNPGFVFAFLLILIRYNRGWTHHALMSIRILIALSAAFWLHVLKETVSFLFAVELGGQRQAILIACLSIHASHYFIPACSKLQLGRRWYSWMIDNRLHYLSASAYMWGWMRFLTEETAIRFLRIVRLIEKPLAFYTIVIECGVVLMLVDTLFCEMLLVGATMLNLGIFVSGGILFGEHIVTNILLLLLLQAPGIPDGVFGWESSTLLWVTLYMTTKGRLWAPDRLGWWDTPFVARIRWEVVGMSGTVYGLYNDFMCPYERLFGRTHGYFLVNHRIIHGHLGIVWNERIRDLIVASNGETRKIDEIKLRYGKCFRDQVRDDDHIRFMRSFLKAYNSGRRKSSLCGVGRILKAPGGHFFYWGTRQRFQGQEPVDTLIIRYTEQFYKEDRFLTLRNEVIRTLNIKDEV